MVRERLRKPFHSLGRVAVHRVTAAKYPFDDLAVLFEGSQTLLAKSHSSFVHDAGDVDPLWAYHLTPRALGAAVQAVDPMLVRLLTI
jgi:hypothetical protein